MDCAAARKFFLAHGVDLVEYDVTKSEETRDQMLRDFGRVATPAIVIGKRVFWGFEENKGEIAELLGIDLTADTQHSRG